MSLAIKMVLEKLKASHVKCGLKKVETALANVDTNPIILIIFAGNRLSHASIDSILLKFPVNLPYIFWETEEELGNILRSPGLHGLLCAAILEDSNMDDPIKAALKIIIDMIKMLLKYEQETLTLIEQLRPAKITPKVKEKKVKGNKVKENEMKENNLEESEDGDSFVEAES